MPESQLTFIKLGGSLITDKDQANTARPEAIRGLLHQVKLYLDANPGQKVLLGHGSGSFGHQAARPYATQPGAHSPQEWLGFRQVGRRPRQLNQIVIDQALALGLPVTLLVNGDGCLLAHMNGPAEWASEDALALIRAALGG